MKLYAVLAESHYEVRSGASNFHWITEARAGHIVAEDFDDCLRILKKSVSEEKNLTIHSIERVKDINILNGVTPDKERNK